MKHPALPLLIVSVLLSSCSNSSEDSVPEYVRALDNVAYFSADSEPLYSLDLEREVAFGDTDSIYFQSLYHFTFDGEGNFIAVNNGGLNGDTGIYLFDNEGNYLQKIGREGQGPGEYQSPRNPQIRNGHLYINDYMMSKVLRYSTPDYEHDSSILMNPSSLISSLSISTGMVSRSFPLSNNHLLIELIGMNSEVNESDSYLLMPIRTYMVVDQDGQQISDEIVSIPMTESLAMRTENGGMGIGFEFKVNPSMDISLDDNIYLVESVDFHIKKYDIDGTYQSSIYYDFKRKPLDFEAYLDEKSYSTDVERAIRNHVEVPETWPAIRTMIIDDEDRIWVSGIVSNEDIYEWWVLEESGRLLAKLELPRLHTISDVKDGAVYIREIDEETNVVQVVRYRLQMTAN